MTDGVPRSGDLPPGHDEEDPYADVDVETLPDWWRENVERFRAHRMRPYRPPAFADGTVLPGRVRELESELDVEIRLQKRIGPDEQEEGWTVVVDDEPVTGVDRVRTEEGRSVYSISADEFERLVREAVE
ncbi:hypothetical protein BRC83_06325 [Halobacteriales archaeon QS_1_68_17]|nr:MAG: hypothetical protein BRC83_06325 [Halobacteriales archaeon QS_1_68_17]